MLQRIEATEMMDFRGGRRGKSAKFSAYALAVDYIGTRRAFLRGKDPALAALGPDISGGMD